MSRFVALAAALALGGCQAADDPPLLVFTAASMTDVAEALAADFEAVHPGVTVTISPGASSTLARQIVAGAPADVFLSASRAWTDYLRPRTEAEPVVLARNQLVVVTANGTASWADPTPLMGMGRVALADPTHVPAGQYAREVLAPMWDRLADRVIPTVDVRAALAAVQSGAADAAVVYATDARVAPGLAVVYTFPDAAHVPIEFVGLVTNPARAEAGAWLAFLTSPEAASRWQGFGFEPVPAAAP